MVSDLCPHCRQPLPSQENQITVDRQKVREFEEGLDEQWFSEKCWMLLRHPALEDERYKAALSDFPKALKKYGRLTKSQYKFFGIIHSKLTGTWPSKPGDKAVEEPPPF